MNHGPVVGRTDKGKQAHKALEPLSADSIAQCGPFPVAAPRLDEHDRRRCKQEVFKVGFWLRPVDRSRYRFEGPQDCVQIALPGSRLLEQPDELGNGLSLHQYVTRGVAASDEEPAVTGDAVANFAKAGEIYEQPFLEERRNWTVQVQSCREIPEPFHRFRRFGSGLKKVGHEAEAVENRLLKGCA